MAPCRLIRILLDIVIMGELSGEVEVAKKGQTIGKSGSAESWGFDQRNYVGRFAMDIVNLTTKEKGCFI